MKRVEAVNTVEDNVQVFTSGFESSNSFGESLEESSMEFTNESVWDGNVINVHSKERNQIMLGIGGALTESAVSVINGLNEDKQQEIYDAYFGQEGAKYTLIRSHIGSADFSTSEYSYAPDKEESINTELENFSIQEDMDDIIPAIKRVINYNHSIKFFAAPWAPPGWMKESGYRFGNGDGEGININLGSISTTENHMKSEYYNLYAKYFIKYIQKYKEQGINVYSISLQNEAQNNPTWEACYWPQESAINFIADYLGPQLEEANLQDVKLLIWDWDKQEGAIGKGDGFITFNRNLLNSRAGQYIDGVAYHWYGPANIIDEINRNPTWAVDDFENITTLKKQFPQKHFIATEGCQEKGPWLNSNEPAKRYVFDMINDFKHGTEGWIDWNVVLNQDGGPLHRETNYCHAPIMVRENTGEIIYNPAYFVLKHMSNFVRPGDIKINTTDNIDTYKDEKGLHHVAFIDGETDNVKLIVGNITNQTQEFLIREGGRTVKTSIQPMTLKTFIFDKGENMTLTEGIDKPSNSSSFEDNPVKDYRPYRAFDGEKNSRWASNWNSHREWIQVDLGVTRSITGIDLDWQYGWKNDYSVQVSDDGENWTTARFISGEANLKNGANDHYPMSIAFPAIEGRFVRLQGEYNRQGYGYSLYDMKIVTLNESSGYMVDDTVAINKSASASSYERNLINDYSPSRAFDDNNNSRWASDWNNDGEWIKVDLGERKLVNGAYLIWEWGWKNIYEIQTSLDGVNWTTAVRIDGSPDGKGATFNNPAGNLKETRVTFEPREAIYVKMQGIQNKQGYGYSLYELKVLNLIHQ